MTRFAGDSLLMDNPILIGGFRLPLTNAVLVNATLARNGAGDVSINVAAAQAATITFDVAPYIKQINSLLSSVSTNVVAGQLVPAQKAADGTNLVLGDAAIAKGVKITDISVAYSIQTNPLTTHTCRLDQNVFTVGANAITSLLASGANGLTVATTAAATTCNLVKIPPTTPAFDITDNDGVFFEIAPTTPAASTYRLYSVFVHCAFNFN